MILLGSHVSMKAPDYFLGSVRETLDNKATALMIYTGPPQNNIRTDLKDLKINEALELLSRNNINYKNIIVHAPYLINLANPDLSKFKFSVDTLINEIIRSEAMKASWLVLHPGSDVMKNGTKALEQIAVGIKQALDKTSNCKVGIAIETMAGKGNETCRNFEEIKFILNLLDNHPRVKVCFDTCHVFDAGYNIKEDLEAVIKDFDKIVGIKNITVFHINDSKNICGSHKDRHENIGYGNIGFTVLHSLIHDPRFINIPKILETPYINDKSPYKEEIAMLLKGEFNKNLK